MLADHSTRGGGIVNSRLLFMADAFDMSGGGEVVVDHLSRALGDRWDVSVLTTTRGPDAVQRSDRLTVHQLHSKYHPRLRPAMSFMNPLLGRKISGLLHQLRPDVIHAWNVHSHLSYDALRGWFTRIRTRSHFATASTNAGSILKRRCLSTPTIVPSRATAVVVRATIGPFRRARRWSERGWKSTSIAASR
jgi:hypothetical protein